MKALGKQTINFYAYLTVGGVILAILASLGWVSIESITEGIYALVGLSGAVIALYKTLQGLDKDSQIEELKQANKRLLNDIKDAV